MRTKEEIKKEMTDAFLADAELQLKYGFDPQKTFAEQFSKVSIENIIFSIVASAIWLLESLFDKHTEEVADTIGKRAHTLNWYREKALNFQFGKDLEEDVAEYDNSGLTDDQVAQQKIVSKCAVTNAVATYPTLLVKAVTANGKMTADQLSAFTAYMAEIADAGMRLEVVSKDTDQIKFGMVVWFDPLLINEKGTLYNENKENIIVKYVNDYFAQLPFNGAFYPRLLESYLVGCEGIKMAKINTAVVTYDNGTTTSTEDISGLDSFIPYSGAMTISNDLTGITYEQFNG